MTTTSGTRTGRTAPPAALDNPGSAPIAPSAWLFVAGGALWASAALIGGEDGTTRFRIAAVVWLGSHLVLLAATLGLWRSNLHRPTRTAAALFGLVGAGRAVFAVAEVVALAVDETQDLLLPVAAMATAVGTVGVGSSILRAGRWTGRTRFAVLASGLYPFVAMFPLPATHADGPPAASLFGWGVVTAVVGLGLLRQLRSVGSHYRNFAEARLWPSDAICGDHAEVVGVHEGCP